MNGPTVMRHGRHWELGFTLLETLIALTLLALLMVALTQGVRLSVDVWRVQVDRISTIAGLDSTARTLRRMLTTIPVQPSALSAPPAIMFKGSASQLAIVGELPTGLGTIRQVDILIFSRAGRVMISWMPHCHEMVQTALPRPTETELVDGIAGLEFGYWGSPRPNLPATWLTRWDGPAMPALVRVKIRFPPGDGRHFPDLIVAPRLWNPAA